MNRSHGALFFRDLVPGKRHMVHRCPMDPPEVDRFRNLLLLRRRIDKPFFRWISFPSAFFYLTAIFLLAGISIEIVSHIFEPLSNEYRFSGGVHPNIQAINCVMMLLGAVSLAERTERRQRIFQWIAAAIAFLFLILTKSRTSLLCHSSRSPFFTS